VSGEFPFESMDSIREVCAGIAEPPPSFRDQATVLAFNRVSATQRELTDALNQGARDREQLQIALDALNAMAMANAELHAANRQLLDDVQGLALLHVSNLAWLWERVRLRAR
jgi:hypothetical protein